MASTAHKNEFRESLQRIEEYITHTAEEGSGGFQGQDGAITSSGIHMKAFDVRNSYRHDDVSATFFSLPFLNVDWCQACALPLTRIMCLDWEVFLTQFSPTPDTRAYVM